jgi:hypothetical protein
MLSTWPRNEQLHAFKTAVDQDGAETLTTRIHLPWRPPQMPGISQNPSELTAEATSSETLPTSPANCVS